MTATQHGPNPLLKLRAKYKIDCLTLRFSVRGFPDGKSNLLPTSRVIYFSSNCGRIYLADYIGPLGYWRMKSKVCCAEGTALIIGSQFTSRFCSDMDLLTSAGHHIKRLMAFTALVRTGTAAFSPSQVRAGGGDLAAGLFGGLAIGTLLGAATAPRYYGPTLVY
jgi:hypothetical protein